ncbi:MAG: succinylglutamate desuccinylase/aspartoacylase family protein [Burkholderiales bacterium]|nr:succinylglutamate desuccinylase/aspartoacylase family protein [Burkholderiales bacterium]
MQTLPPIEIQPRDLAPYRKGNVGVDYVHRFHSGRSGPHVLVNALTHGNELCGMVAATHLLDAGVRPRVGTLTVSFANVAAYASFDPARPFDSRQLVHNLNRVWSSEWLDGDEDSPELARARQMRAVVAAADHILDIHSTSNAVPPFWVYPAFERNAVAARAIGRPSVHLVMPQGLGTGTPLIQHGLHGGAGHHGVGLVAECGQHFRRSTGETAIAVTLDFLAYFGLVARALDAPPAQRRFRLLRTCMVTTPEFRFVRPLVGFEVFGKDELIATDGAEEIRAPCERCTVLMPARQPTVGREGVYLTEPVDG